MKTTLRLFLAVILLSLVACKPSPQKAQAYYSDITKPIESVLTKEDELIKVINANMNKDSTQSVTDKKDKNDKEVKIANKALDMAFANFCLQISTSINQIEGIGKFDNSATLHDAALDMLTEYKTVSEQEYPALIAIVKIPDAEYTNEHDTKFFDLSDSIDNKLQRKISAYIQQVKLFSQEYNFELEKDSVN